LYVVRWDTNIEAEIELDFRDFNACLALHFADGTFQHLRVEFEAHGFDVAALLSAEKIPRASQFEIEGGDLEACAEVGKFLERGEAAARDGRQFNFRRQEQVGVGATVRPANPSSKLIELRQTQPVGPIDDDRVAQRDVEAVLDNRGRDQDVGFVMHEFQHHLFQLPFAHLPMAHGDTSVRGEGLNFGGNLPYGVYAVVHEI